MDSEKKRQYDMDNRVNPMKVDILELSTRSFLFPFEIAKMLGLCRHLKLGWNG